MIFFQTYDSPLGRMVLQEDNGFLIRVDFDSERLRIPEGAVKQESLVLREAIRQLNQYFQGTRTSFQLPLDPHGTAFQQRAWKALQEIPFGETRSYQEQAIRVGGKNYTRAVGGANRRNPISIIIPCHRVIGKNGALTGFGSGLDRKQALLDLEQATSPSS